MSVSSPFHAAAWRRAIVVIVAAVLVWVMVPPQSAQAATGLRVDLRVLLLSNASSSTAAFATLMDREGVPYTQVNISDPAHPTINDAFLADAVTGRGNFQAVVMPNQSGPGLSAAEMTALANYERSYGVRQVDAYVFPGADTGQSAYNYSGTLDGAAATVTADGLAGPFSYLNGPVAIDDFDAAKSEVSGYLAVPAPSLPAGATFTPLVNATIAGHSGTIIGVYGHDFREELVITANYNADQEWFTEVGHGILTWMTRGLHLGYHRNYLTVHVDDIFLPDSRWSSIQNCTPGDTPTCIDHAPSYIPDIRMVPSDVTRLVNWQTTNHFTFDMLFNAQGSDAVIADSGTDPLTTAFLAAKNNFTWVNHTYSHPFLGCIQIAPTLTDADWHCATPTDTGGYYDDSLVGGTNETLSGGIRWLSQLKITSEITQNQQWAVTNGLPNFDAHALVTGEHSGLLTNPEQPIDNPFLAPALQAAGITYTGSDASREPNSRLVQGGTTRTLPRYPMNIFYNAGTYQDEVDEYNWVYTSTALGGSGICTANPGTSTCITPLANANSTQAQASFTNYIVPLEVRNAYRKVITNDPRPFYAHQSNLAENGILYPVVAGILAKYRSTYNDTTSPIVSEDLVSLGEALTGMTNWTSVKGSVTAYVDASGVHVSGPAGTQVPLTVPTGTTVNGAPFQGYDGELSGWLTASPAGALVAVPTIPMGGYIGHTVPDAPTNVTATSGQFLGSLTLAWTAPVNDGNTPITGYEIQQSPATGTPAWTTLASLTGDTTSYLVTGLTEGTNYLYQVRAVNAVGAGPWSTPPLTATPGHVLPGAPTNVVATSGTTAGTVDLSWSAATTDPNLPITGYKIQQSPATGTPAWTSIAWIGPVTTYTVTDLIESSSYIFQVSAVNALGDGPWSSPPATAVAAAIQYPAVAAITAPDVTFGADASITLRVETAEGHVPSGTATLTFNGSPQSKPIAGNEVTFSVPGLAVGTYAYTVDYGADLHIQPFSKAGTFTVTKAAVTAAGVVQAAPTTVQSGTYKVTVTQPPGLPTATGAVTLTLTKGSETKTIGGALDNGAATLTVPPLGAGTWTASIAYAGDANYLAAPADGAPVVSAQVAPGTVAGTVTKAPTTQVAGTYQVTVTPGDGLPQATGDVRVTLTKDSDTRDLGPVTLEGGTASVDLPHLPAGTWTASIAYAGDANYLAAPADGAPVVSAKVAVGAVVGTISTAPTPQKPGKYKVTVTEPSGLAPASGTVEVKLSDTETLSGSLSGGVATITVPARPEGTWNASVTYKGDDNYTELTVAGAPVESTKGSVTVTGAVVTAPTVHEPGAYKVTVTEPSDPSDLAKASGTVTVTLTSGAGTTPAIHDAVLADDGTVTVTLPPLAAGRWDVKIAYGGDDNYATVEEAAGAPVDSTDAVPSTVVGSITPAPNTQQNGIYKVTVPQLPGLVPATGPVTVTLTLGSTVRTVPGTISAGEATLSLPELPAGTWTAAVAYGGDWHYAPSTFTGVVVVSKLNVSTVVGTVITKPTTTKAGSYKVTVTQPSGLAAATGTVALTLKLGSATKTINGTLSGGAVTVTVPAPAAGTWTASIAYAGDANYVARTAAGPSVVSAKSAVAKVTTAITKVPTSKKSGSYKVTVTPPSGGAKATGKVTVTLKKGSTTKKVTGTLKAGAVTVTVPKLAKGIWKASVAYAGDATYTAKTVTGLSVVSGKTSVSKLATKVTKVPTTKATGTYTVTVKHAANLATAGGKVTVTLKKGSVTKKVTGTLKSGAVTIKVPKLAKGTWKATVSYSGSSTYLAKKATGASVVVKK